MHPIIRDPSVVIRFQICIFDILNTAGRTGATQRGRCDSLSNLYLWHIKYSLGQLLKRALCVVIRFQICIFDILNTATRLLKNFAESCDSLSNLYLWHIKYSRTEIPTTTPRVVIRFQICIFDILNTAKGQTAMTRYSCDSLSNLYLWHIKYSSNALIVESL